MKFAKIIGEPAQAGFVPVAEGFSPMATARRMHVPARHPKPGPQRVPGGLIQATSAALACGAGAFTGRVGCCGGKIAPSRGSVVYWVLNDC
jgi:hypothetical protein